MPYDEAQAAMLREYMIKENEKVSDAWYATGQIWDDGIIDPRDTRHVLGICLACVHNQPIAGTNEYGVFRM
jgi:acetyl-CoA carboxylase carboxyltransferase component